MMSDELKALEQENRNLKRQVWMETIRRLSAEQQAANASLAAIQMRIPMLEREMEYAKQQLAGLTKDNE